jgi:hypothetical protein
MPFVYYQLLILSDVVLLVGASMSKSIKRISLFIIIVFPIFCFSQKIEYYNYGYEGIDKILKVKDSTFIFCNSKARPYIKEEVIDSVIERYQRGKMNSGNIILQLKNAKVFGFIEILKSKNKVKSITITYQKIEYKNGLTEIYKKPN